jgi:hypothetical protein
MRLRLLLKGNNLPQTSPGAHLTAAVRGSSASAAQTGAVKVITPEGNVRTRALCVLGVHDSVLKLLWCIPRCPCVIRLLL